MTSSDEEVPTMPDKRTIGPQAAKAFLREASKYFETRPTHGEDRAHWSNVYNAENCRLIADMIEKMAADHQEPAPHD